MHSSAFVRAGNSDENISEIHTFGAGKPQKSSKSQVLADITNFASHAQYTFVGASMYQEKIYRYPAPTGNSQHMMQIPIVLPIDDHLQKDLPESVLDIDASDAGKHLTECRLARQIHHNLFHRECMLMAEPGYMQHQPEITGNMRAILIDWLVDVHLKFELREDTLFLAVNLLDRFLEDTPVPRSKLQLVGMVAMFIASKYEEIYFPSVADFVHIADKTYTRENILVMEATMLNALKFNITTPYSWTFLRRNLKALRACYAKDEKDVGHLASFCLDLALQDYAMLGFCPSEIAAAACLLAGRIVWEEVAWNETMRYYSGDWDVESLRECEEHLVRLLENEQGDGGKLTAIKRKFASEKYGKVSTIAASVDLSLPYDDKEDIDME